MRRSTSKKSLSTFDKGLKLEIESHRLLLKKLTSVYCSLSLTVEREKAKRAERTNILSEYKTEEEIQDAYGYNFITDGERQKLLEELETGKIYIENTQTKASIALDLLGEFMNRIERQVSSLEFELLTPEEKETIREASEKMRERVEARRADRRGGA